MSANLLQNVNCSSFKEKLSKGFSVLQQNAEFVDVTLAAEGYFTKAHQNVLALASPYIKEILLSTPCQNPVIFLNNVTQKLLEYVLEYIYTGEVNVPKNMVDEFVALCRRLCIQGVEYCAVPSNQSHTEDTIGRSVQELDHNYTSHIIIETQGKNVGTKPILCSVGQELLPDDHILGKDELPAPITIPDPPKYNISAIEKRTNMSRTRNQNTVNNVYNGNLANTHEETSQTQIKNNLPDPYQDNIMPDINQEVYPCTQSLDLPILLEEITVRPQTNIILPEYQQAKDMPQDYISISEENEPSHVTVSNLNEDNVIKDLADFIIINADRTKTFSDNPIEKATSASDVGAGVYKPGTRLADSIPQFRVSKRGTLHLMLNKYLYHCHHQSSGGQKRRWRCIHYRKLHCRAVIDTFGDEVTNRYENHIHPAPTITHINRFRRDTIYTLLSKAAIVSNERTHVIRKRK